MTDVRWTGDYFKRHFVADMYCPTWTKPQWKGWRRVLIRLGLPCRWFKHEPLGHVAYQLPNGTTVVSPETYAWLKSGGRL